MAAYTFTLDYVLEMIREALQAGEGFACAEMHFPYEPLIAGLLKIPGVEREDYLRSDTSLEAPGFHGPDKWPHHWSQTVSYGGNYYVLRGSARIGGIEFGPEIFELED